MAEPVNERDIIHRLEDLKIVARTAGDVDIAAESLLGWMFDPDEGQLRAAADGYKSFMIGKGVMDESALPSAVRGLGLAPEDRREEVLAGMGEIEDRINAFHSARYERASKLYRPTTTRELEDMLVHDDLGHGGLCGFASVTTSPLVACRYLNYPWYPHVIIELDKAQLDPHIVHPEYRFLARGGGGIAGPIPGDYGPEEEHRIPSGTVAHADLDMIIHILNTRGGRDVEVFGKIFSTLGPVRFSSALDPGFAWHVPGEDGGVRFGPRSVEAWEEAHRAVGEPGPGAPGYFEQLDTDGAAAVDSDEKSRDYLNGLWLGYCARARELESRIRASGTEGERASLRATLRSVVATAGAKINTFYMARYERADSLYHIASLQELYNMKKYGNFGEGGGAFPYMSFTTNKLAVEAYARRGRECAVMAVDKSELDRFIVHQRYNIDERAGAPGISAHQYAYFAAEEEHRIPKGPPHNSPGMEMITAADFEARIDFLTPPQSASDVDRMAATFRGWFYDPDMGSVREAAREVKAGLFPEV